MRKSYLFGALAVAAVAIAAISCTEQKQEPQGLVIEKQGVFSSGGRVTEAIPGEYDPTQNWLDQERKGTTTHVDHANTMYQIPAGGSGTPMVFLHGYGQTRTGWQSTPDGREGWSDLFLKKGYSVFLVDQPRRGAAGATEQIVNDPGDVANGKFKVGEQAWYTHFRIGRVAPERYEGSQFPEGDEALEEFFCQMTPNTGNYDEPLFGKALTAVLKDVQTMTGKKSIYVTHSQGGRVGWATDTDNMAAIIVSRKDKSGGWFRSNCQLVLNEAGFGSDLCSLSEAVEKSYATYDIDMESEFYLNNAASGGTGTTEDVSPSGGGGVEPGEPSFNTTASINGVNQSIAGGSVTATAPIASVVVSGTNLGEVAFTAKVDGTGDAINPTSHDANGASFTGLNVAAGHSLTVYRGGTVWFTITAQDSGGGIE